MATGSTRPREELLPTTTSPPPGTCPTSLITDSQQAVRSLIERPWGEGTAETVKYPEGDTAIPSQKQNMATPLSPTHARVGCSRGQKKPLAAPH